MKNKILTVMSILFGLLLLNGGLEPTLQLPAWSILLWIIFDHRDAPGMKEHPWLFSRPDATCFTSYTFDL